MKAAGTRPTRRLVLIGGGHSHVVVLKGLGMAPEPGLEVVLVAKELDAPYSGMLPGYVSGHYSLDECHIDLVPLSHFAGARLIHGEACGLDRERRLVHLRDRPPITYDLVSFDTGITPATDDIAGAGTHGILVKPVSGLAPRWQRLLDEALAPDGPRRIVVIGTGAAGFELVLAIRHRLRIEAPLRGIDADRFGFTLIGSGGLLATHNGRARRLAEVALRDAGVEVLLGDGAVAIGPKEVRLASGRSVASDAVLVTTKAAPPAWFRDTGLSLDPRGFLLVEPTLQVVGESHVFAVGDCATVAAHPREKAGVFAVRQGPPLLANIRRIAQGVAPLPFVPQTRFLTLLSTGGREAIASRGGWSAAGRWAWQLKDRIDRAFMRKFQVLPDVPEGPVGSAGELLCGGCAAKLGPQALSGALDRASELTTDGPRALAAGDRARGAVQDLARRDDAALLDLGGDMLRLESVDQFPAIWPDPFVLGEIVAAHATGDVLAKGGRPDHALALVGLPPAASHLQEDDLVQVVAGMRRVLAMHGATLVGGHTQRSEGLSAGLFVSGLVARDGVLLKGGLKPGDGLYLTKPIGTGILFAGWMRRRAKAREVTAALTGMRRPSLVDGAVLASAGASAATDVTGFGLAGHLIDMLDGARLAAHVDLSAVPLYAGVLRLLSEGVRSSLLAENLALAARIETEPGADREALLALLLDPQTAGGLLIGVSRDAQSSLVAAIRECGDDAVRIGEVIAKTDGATTVLSVTGSPHRSATQSPGGVGPISDTTRAEKRHASIKTS